MDEMVARAMRKWPDVPNVFGWLRLDRRGNWLVKTRSGAFDRIGNRALTEFIGRNYAVDNEGRWYFQNGPQRVFVSLDYTPWVYRIADNGNTLVVQNGDPVARVGEILLDEAGSVLLVSEIGVGVVSDRDLAPLIDRLEAENPPLQAGELLAELAAPSQSVRLFGNKVGVARVQCQSIAMRFGFNPRPVAPSGTPDC